MHPQPEQESILRTFLLGGLELEVYLDCLLRATTKKGRQLFLTKNVHPRQNPGYAYVCNHKLLCVGRTHELFCHFPMGLGMSQIKSNQINLLHKRTNRPLTLICMYKQVKLYMLKQQTLFNVESCSTLTHIDLVATVGRSAAPKSSDVHCVPKKVTPKFK